MTPKQSAEELEARQCTAKSKRTGERCRRWSLAGRHVCMMHGAGTRVRQARTPKDGRPRRDPTCAALKHGRYASRVPDTLAQATVAYGKAGEELYRLDTIAARTWVHLEHCDALLAATQTAVQSDGAEMDAFAPHLAALMTVDRALGRLVHIVSTRHRILCKSEAISRGEMVAVLRLLAQWVDDLALDESVPRDEIRGRLAERVRDYVLASQQERDDALLGSESAGAR
jgi:hypothetical protein